MNIMSKILTTNMFGLGVSNLVIYQTGQTNMSSMKRRKKGLAAAAATSKPKPKKSLDVLIMVITLN